MLEAIPGQLRFHFDSASRFHSQSDNAAHILSARATSIRRDRYYTMQAYRASAKHARYRRSTPRFPRPQKCKHSFLRMPTPSPPPACEDVAARRFSRADSKEDLVVFAEDATAASGCFSYVHALLLDISLLCERQKKRHRA